MFARSSYSVAYPFPDMSQCLTVLLQVACHMMNYLQHLCGALTFSKTVVVFYVHSWIHNDLTVAMVGSSVDLTYEYQVTVLLNGIQIVLVRHDPCLLLNFLCIYIYIHIISLLKHHNTTH